MISISKSILLLSLFSLASASTAKLLNDNHQYGTLSFDDYDRPGTTIDEDILEMTNKMTIEEKIGQMTQINQDLVLNKNGKLNRTAVEHYAKNYYIGSYLNQLARYYSGTNAMLIILIIILMHSDGTNYDSADYARLIEEIQEITISVNSTFKIPIIYGYIKFDQNPN
jgi:beta-glucosidase